MISFHLETAMYDYIFFKPHEKETSPAKVVHCDPLPFRYDKPPTSRSKLMSDHEPLYTIFELE